MCRLTQMFRVGVVGLCVLAGAATTAAQVRMEFREGLVSLSATNVPLADVMQAWERAGGTKVLFFPADRLPRDLVTVTFEAEPEASALQGLLGGMAGFVTRDRPGLEAGRSRFALLLVLSESSVRDGGAAARRVMEASLTAPDSAPPPGEAVGERLVDYRDLPPKLPGDPNGPVGLTPASPGFVDPPPLELSAEQGGGERSKRDPAVNPIPARLPPPPPQVVSPMPLSPLGGASAPAKPKVPTSPPAPPGKPPGR